MSHTIAGLIFGVFCMFAVVVGAMYVAAMNNQAPVITDSYGNTLGNTTNTSQSLANSENLTPGFGVMGLLTVVILLIAVIFGFYVASKTFL